MPAVKDQAKDLKLSYIVRTKVYDSEANRDDERVIHVTDSAAEAIEAANAAAKEQGPNGQRIGLANVSIEMNYENETGHKNFLFRAMPKSQVRLENLKANPDAGNPWYGVLNRERKALAGDA